MDAQQLEFIASLTGMKAALDARAERQNARRAAFDTALAGLEEKTAAIRDGFQDVRLVDAQGKQHAKAVDTAGQEKALDTFKATRKGQGLTAEDMKKVGQALKPISEAAQALLAAATPDGKPLFDSQQEFEAALTEELFTPMVRRGLLPENFVIDKYSEVQKLLNATFAAYRERSRADAENQETAAAREMGNRKGASTGLEMVAANMKALSKVPDKLAKKAIKSRELRQGLAIGAEVVGTALSANAAATTLRGWADKTAGGDPRIVARMGLMLDPTKATRDNMGDAAHKLLPTAGGVAAQDADPDNARAQISVALREAKLRPKMDALGLPKGDQDRILAALNLQDDTLFNTVMEGTAGLGGVVADVLSKIAAPAVTLASLKSAIDSSHHESRSLKAALQAVQRIDARVVAQIDKHVRPSLGAQLAGQYADSVDIGVIQEAVSSTRAADQAMVAEFGQAFENLFADTLGPALAGVGKKLMQAFKAGAQGLALQAALKTAPETAFDPLVAAADAALDATLGAVDKSLLQQIDSQLLRQWAPIVAKEIDAALVQALQASVGAGAAAAFEGLYASAVDTAAVVKAAAASPANGAAVVQAYAGAFHSAMAQAAPDPADTAVVGAGKALEAAMNAAGDGAAFATTVQADVAAAFRQIVTAARGAMGSALGRSGDELKRAFATPDAQRALAAKAAFPDGGEAALAELEASEAEVKEYEQQLALIDDVGVAAADLHSIESLIEKLAFDKKVADMVVASGSVLSSAVGSSMTLAGLQTEAVTDTLVGEVVGPLKAAKLIIKFGFAMKAAHERWKLLQKFRASLNLAHNAVSPLQSTIQGLLDNKQEQMTLRAIEDALMLIQIAAAVLGSVPEPVTMAVGKTLGAVARAAEGAVKVSGMIYNEAMLRKGWSTTLAAVRNPRDRAAGLAALRLNPTLGMHAIAWAGMEKVPADPVARSLLASLGLNEQTLQASGTEDKVRKYLETLLADDRVLVDAEQLAPKWIPKPLSLTVESWVVVTHRATTLAEPKLRATSEHELLAAFKKIDAQDLAALDPRAQLGQIDEAAMDALRAEAAVLTRLLRAYSPICSDGSEHEEMTGVTATYLKLASEREAALTRLAQDNAMVRARDVDRAATRAGSQTDAMRAAVADGTEPALRAALKRGGEMARELQLVRVEETGEDKALYEHSRIAPLYAGLMAQVQAAATALQRLQQPSDADDAGADTDTATATTATS